MSDGQSLTRVTQKLDGELKDPRDRALVRACLYGVLRHCFALRAHLKQFVRKPLRAKDADIEALLLLGAYQLLHMDVPAHAAVSQHVEAARELNKTWACRLINAVLRKVAKSTLANNPQQPPDEQFNHPQWLIDCITKAWPEHWADILRNNNQHAPLVLRINQRQLNREDYLAALGEQGIEAEPTQYADNGVVLTSARAVESLPGFAAGWFSVQDEAAQLAAPLLLQTPASRVLDACAAPGGKTGHLLELATPGMQLTSLDNDAERLQRVISNLERLGLTAHTLCADAAEPQTWWDGELFDAILLDAPCSATGVIRRHPDIRFHRREADLKALAATQRNLLSALWHCLAPQGHLLYVTCSVLPQENDAAVQHLLESEDDSQHCPILMPSGIKTEWGHQILPGDDGMDGFYFSLLKKQANLVP